MKKCVQALCLAAAATLFFAGCAAISESHSDDVAASSARSAISGVSSLYATSLTKSTTLTSTTTAGNYTIYATSAKTVTIPAISTVTINGTSLDRKIYLGGAGSVANYRCIGFTTGGAASVTVYADGASGRYLGLFDASGNLISKNEVSSSVASYSYTISASGTYYLMSTGSAISIYYIKTAVSSSSTGSSSPSYSTTTAASGMKVSSDEVVFIPSASSTLVSNATALSGIGNGSVYYMATTGSDSNSGSFSAPFATLRKAIETMSAGDTLYIRGGTYKVTADQIMVSDPSKISTAVAASSTGSSETVYTRIYDFSKGGSGSSSTISFIGYPGERPVFDFSAIDETVVEPSSSANYRRIAAFHVSKSYYYFRNFEIVGVQQNNTTKNQCECIRVSGGNHNTFENLSMHDGMAIGWYLAGGTYNLVLNCDAYNNVDTKSDTSGDGVGGDTDGFGCHTPNVNHKGNLIVGCRAWLNSDDGFDLINAKAKVELQSCWAMQNGYADPNNDGSKEHYSAGNGLKSGGYAYTDVSGVFSAANPVPTHAVTNSIASKNYAHGVYANHHIYNETAGGGLYFAYNSAYGNAYDYSMETRYQLEAVSTSNSSLINQYAKGYTLKNNLNYTLSGKTAYQYLSLTDGNNTLSNNTFQNSSHTVTSSDFESTDWTELYMARDTSTGSTAGNLPQVSFLKLKSSSYWYNASADSKAGFDYNRYLDQVSAARSAAGCGRW